MRATLNFVPRPPANGLLNFHLCMANLPNLPHNEGASEKNISHDSSKIVNLDKVRHVMSEPPAEPQNFGELGRRFTPEQMRKPVTDAERTTPLCNDLIHSDEFVIISGQSGTGKTAFLVELLSHVQRPGGLFMGHPRLKNHSARPLRSAFLDCELRSVMQRQRSSSYWGDVEYFDLGQAIDKEKLHRIRSKQLSRSQLAQQMLFDLITGCEFDFIGADSMQRLLPKMTREYVEPFINTLTLCMDFYRNQTGRHINVAIVSHPRKGDAGEAASRDNNSGDSMLVDQSDVTLVVRHGRDLHQAYVVQVKEGRGHGGAFTGMRNGGDGECLVYHRHKVDDPIHRDNFRIELSHERHLERDVMPQIGKGASEAGKVAEAEEVARFMNDYATRSTADTITPAAVSKAIERASAANEIDLPGKKTIAPATLVRMSPNIRKHLHLDVLKRLSSDWR